MSDLFRFAQLQPYTLYGAGASLGDTSIILSSMTDIDGNALSMSADFGTIGYGTLDPGNGSLEEQISFTGLVNNANGTVTLSGVKSVLFLYPYTETSGLAKTHAGATPFVISNTSGFYNKFVTKDNDGTVNQELTFTTLPQSSVAPVSNTDFVNKLYADTHGGTPSNYDQNIIAGFAGENLTGGQAVYLKSSDGKWYRTDATTSSKCNGVILGIVQATALANAAITVCVGGVDKTQTGLVAGTVYYLSDTPGAISSSAGTNSVVIGECNTVTTQLVLSQRFTQMPTGGQKAALASTTTPSATNLYETQTDFQKGAEIYGVDSVGSDAYVITPTPAVGSYTAGMTFRVKVGTANTGAATLQVGSGSAVAILKNGNQPLITGDILSGQIITVTYDGTNWQLAAPTVTEYRLLAKDLTGVTIASSTSEVALLTTSIPAGTLQTTNGVKFKMYFTSFILSNTKTATLRLKYGSTTLATATITNSSGAASGSTSQGYIEGYLFASAATNAQKGYIIFSAGPSGTFVDNAVDSAQTTATASGTSAEDSTGALNLVVSCQFNNSSTEDTIVVAFSETERVQSAG